MASKPIRKVEGPCPACMKRMISEGRPLEDSKSEMALQGYSLRCLRCNALLDIGDMAHDLASMIAKEASEQMRAQALAGVEMPIKWRYRHCHDSTIYLVDFLYAVAQVLQEKALRVADGVTH